MDTTHTRRAVLGVVLGTAVGGCLSSPGSGGVATGANSEMTPTDATDRPSLEDVKAQLGDPSPLEAPLPELVAAADRDQFAESAGLEFRDGAVNVTVHLVSGGEAPEQYLPADAEQYDGSVVAFVDVDHLVDLALDENVRFVRRTRQPEADSAQTD